MANRNHRKGGGLTEPIKRNTWETSMLRPVQQYMFWLQFVVNLDLIPSTLKIGGACSSETSVSSRNTTQRQNSDKHSEQFSHLNLINHFKMVRPSIVTDSLWIKPTDALNSNYIGITTLHVSGSLSAHYREFLAVHRLWYILCSCDDCLLPGAGWNCVPSCSWQQKIITTA